MNALPKSALRLLELQTISLTDVGIESHEASQPAKSKDSKVNLFKGMFKKSEATKASKVKSLHDNRKRTYVFNAAAWLRFGLSVEKRNVSLCVVFRDNKGEQVVIVEEQGVSDGGNCMLSGLVEIQSQGPITGLNVAVAGLTNEDRCYVENITFKRQEEAAEQLAFGS